ncbi:hypothetical protein RN001_001311 [Aquatica leii]|uniref:Ig-like domain-containing protein n=1 Tax=Aquatica leii TaxID=1421715 RepID=A0AAN7PBE4_9COLE|nr:hypothetical protein RN001_001311 [Aquatica leii]
MYALLIFILINLLISVNCISDLSTNYGNELGATMNSIVAVQGIVAKLPCDITPTFLDDKLHIVIWNKEDSEGKLIPIYTFDSRHTSHFKQAKHWSDEFLLDGRVHFRYEEDPAMLTINNVLHKDEGFYNCRVDFKRSPTRNTRLNLTVIIPPANVIVLNEKGIKVSNYELGPYSEGDVITLTCIATGGVPVPKVTWWQENALLDDFSEDLANNTVRNILHMEKLQRKHFHRILTCQASNNDFVAPISTSMRIDLNLPPISATFLGENFPLSAGKLYQFKCEVIGSHPAPRITWWKGNTNMVDVETKSANGTAISTLTVIPTADDEGKYLSCNVEHTVLRNHSLVSSRKLSVLYSPLLTLNLGKNLSNKIKEGRDVYFDCNIKANPWVYKISWKHNDKTLNSNLAKGVIINNQSLVLQNVYRDKTGSYLCTAINKEGESVSNSIHLEIEYLPKCRLNKATIYEALLNETLQINCELDANPKEIEYMWTFNNTEGFQQYFSLHRNASYLMYTLKSGKDYGTLFCKGTNEIGDQFEPCVFTIIPRDKMDLLLNCSFNNQHTESLNLACKHRLPVQLNGSFVAEIYDIETGVLIKRLTSKQPTFIINKLDEGLQYEIRVYIITREGTSNVIQLNAAMPKWKTFKDVSRLNFTITPTLAITIGIVVLLVIISIGLLTITKIYKCKKEKQTSNYTNDSLLKPKFADEQFSPTEASDRLLKSDDKNPDIIPLNSSTNVQKTYVSLNDIQADISLHDTPFLFTKEHPRTLSQYNYDTTGRPSNFQSPTFFKYSHSRPARLPEMPVEYHNQDISINVLRPLLTNHINRTPVTLLPQQLSATQL